MSARPKLAAIIRAVWPEALVAPIATPWDRKARIFRRSPLRTASKNVFSVWANMVPIATANRTHFVAGLHLSRELLCMFRRRDWTWEPLTFRSYVGSRQRNSKCATLVQVTLY